MTQKGSPFTPRQNYEHNREENEHELTGNSVMLFMERRAGMNLK
jgi:hypothetical protein